MDRILDRRLGALAFIILWTAVGEVQSENGRIELDLSGNDWRLVSFDAGEGIPASAFRDGYPDDRAIPATVPGDVYWDLERAKSIPPIYIGMNSREAEWVAGKEWWYRKIFTVDDRWNGKMIRLRFEAVDYASEVWLNGQHLGRHEGQFTPFEFDVTDRIVIGNENQLYVLIHPVPENVRTAIANGVGEWEVMKEMRPAYPYWKSMTSSGWDWGCDLISMGIWQDVRLIGNNGVYMSNLTVQPEVPDPYDRAILHVKMRVQAEEQRDVIFTYKVLCTTVKEKPIIAQADITLRGGRQSAVTEIEIPNPHLWWPNGYGGQNLYSLVVTAQDSLTSKVLDQTETSFGIRDLKMLPNPPSPHTKQYKDWYPEEKIVEMPTPLPERSYLIQINGRRIYGRGANWLPSDLLYGRPREAHYERLIRLAVEAHFNLFRIWGGGIVEKQEFFNLCDRYGIMLFAEFPNGGVPLPENDETLHIAETETRKILPLWINHPSIVRYGGGNEWYTTQETSPHMAQLRRICNEVDPTRPFHDPDPEVIAQRHGPHDFRYDSFYQTYNTGYPLTSGPDDPIEWTEYGAAGASSVETLQSILPPQSLWPVDPNDPYWIWHKAFHAYGNDNWLGLSQIELLFWKPADLEMLVRCSQFIQAEAIRYANQSMRRRQWCRSAFASWTYNEPWPNAAHGCLVEYSGQPKMAYYYAKQSCAPIDVSAVYSGLICSPTQPLDAEIWVCNNSNSPLEDGHVRYRIFTLSGTLMDEGEQAVQIPMDRSRKVATISWSPPESRVGGVALLFLEVLDRAESLIARNLYTFGIQEGLGQSLAPLQPLWRAPEAELMLTVEPQKTNGNQLGYKVEVINHSPNPALFVELAIEADQENQKATVYLSDSGFSLPPGESYQVNLIVQFQNEVPRNFTPGIVAKGWNCLETFLKE